MIMELFWVVKNLIDHLTWEGKEVGEAKEKLSQWWIDMVTKSKKLNKKVDIVLQGLGLQAPSTPPLVVIQPIADGSSRQGNILDLSYILL